jgi:glucose/arabinose dehydrogenase
VTRFRSPAVIVVLALAALLGGCSSNKKPKAAETATPTPTESSPSPSPSSSGVATPTPTKKPATKPPVSSTSFDPTHVHLRLVTIASGLTRPLFLGNAGDGTGFMYVVEQAGVILTLDHSGHIRGTFLDIRGRVGSSGNEQGLLGLAFHPAYKQNGRFFVNYTDTAGNTVIAEFHRKSLGVADPASAKTILHFDQPYANHNGGMLAFGRDGYLYIGTGDGGSQGDPHNNGQSLGTLLGKILRIDVNSGSPYAIPPTNPFVSKAGARKEIWAYGLRNPWRFSFDRSTGDVFIGDVGQNTTEEIDARRYSSPAGANFGWHVMEGNSCYQASSCNKSGKTLPVATYPTASGCAVSGGYVYRGPAYASLRGGYFFGDYCNGDIYAFSAARALNGPVSEVRVLNTSMNISSFGQDEYGELYVVNLGGTVARFAV